MLPTPIRTAPALLALLGIGCNHARHTIELRPSIDARQAISTVQVVASPGPPPFAVEGNRGNGSVALHAAGGAVVGAATIPGLCLRAGVIGVVACVIGAVYVGAPVVVAIEGTAAVIGAGVKGSKRSAKFAPARERFRAAEAALTGAVADAGVLDGFGEAVLHAPLGASSFELTTAPAPGAGRAARLEVAVERIALESAAEMGERFVLRVDASGTLRDSQGTKIGEERIAVFGPLTWEGAELKEGKRPTAGAGSGPASPAEPAAPEHVALRDAIRELVARAGERMAEELLVSAARTSPAYGRFLCGSGPVRPSSGKRYSRFSHERKLVQVDARRVLRWEPWKAEREPPGATHSWDLRVWKLPLASAEATPLVEARGLKEPQFELPVELETGDTYAWAVRTEIEAGGKRFTSGWSHLRRNGEDCGLEAPQPGDLLQLRIVAPVEPQRGPAQETAAGEPSAG